MTPRDIPFEYGIIIGMIFGWFVMKCIAAAQFSKYHKMVVAERVKGKVDAYNDKIKGMDYATRFIKKANLDRFLDLASLDLFKESCKAALFEQYLDFFLTLNSTEDGDSRKLKLILHHDSLSDKLLSVIREGFDEIYPAIEKKLPNKYFKHIADNMAEAEVIEKNAKDVLSSIYGEYHDEDQDADPELHPREDVAETTTDESYASIEDIAKYNTVEDADILSKFNYDYISDVIDNSLQSIPTMQQQLPNIVYGYGINFNHLLNGFTGNSKEINDTSRTVYTDIIDKICAFYNVTCSSNPEEIGMDLFNTAYYMYDFFVSKFFDNMILFFSMYIIKERDNIISGFKEIKTNNREADNIIQYTKQIFKSDSLAYIYANIEYVLSSMGTFDIPLNDIIDYVLGENTLESNNLKLIVTDNGNFFRDNYYNRMIRNTDIIADIVVAIRMSLQKYGSQFE